MYSKYGKCKTRKSSKSPAESDKSEKPDETAGETSGETAGKTSGETAGKTSGETAGSEKPRSDSVEDEEVGEEGSYRKGSSQTRDPDEAGFPDTDADHDPTKGSDEKYAEFEGGESGSGADEEENIGGDDAKDSSEHDDEQVAGEESTDEAEKKKRKKVKAVMEYDIKDMYPEINILIQKKKREWDYQDPDIIRALWLETKTLALSEWKVRNAKISIVKPSFEVKETVTVTLRQEHLKNKAELQQALQERDFEMTEASRDPPHFDTIQLATNLTTDMRYKYNRNNPPVPSHYIEHFEKFKKPPFKNNTIRYCHS